MPGLVGEADHRQLPLGLGEALRRGLPNARWVHVAWLVDDLRLVKNPAEQALMRESARISIAAAAAAIGAGVSERHVAACAAMIEAGGTYPGFGPFIRPVARLGEEHMSWGDGRLAAGDPVLLELSGCVARWDASSTSAPCRPRPARSPRSAVTRSRRCWKLCGPARWRATSTRRGRASSTAPAGAHDRRHHCGYVVGIGCPPSWLGGNRVVGLGRGSRLEIRAGTSFHVLSWLRATERGDFFVSDTVLLGADGPEVPTRTPSGLTVR